MSKEGITVYFIKTKRSDSTVRYSIFCGSAVLRFAVTLTLNPERLTFEPSHTQIPEANLWSDGHTAAVGIFYTGVPYNLFSVLSGGLPVFWKSGKFISAIKPPFLQRFLFPHSDLYPGAKMVYCWWNQIYSIFCDRVQPSILSGSVAADFVVSAA